MKYKLYELSDLLTEANNKDCNFCKEMGENRTIRAQVGDGMESRNISVTYCPGHERRIYGMTNYEAYKKFYTCLNDYDEAKDAIYYYPCDDLHSLRGGHDCNCMRHKFREYRSQDEIDERISEYEAAQITNEGLYEVSVDIYCGRIRVKPCKRDNHLEPNEIWRIGSSDNYTVFCYKDDIEYAKKAIVDACIEKLDDNIRKAEEAKWRFVENSSKEE